MSNETKSRYQFIDAVRGIAACSVMLQHSLETSHIENIQDGYFGASWLNLGEVGVLAFFLVSGFVIPLSLEKSNNFRMFWINRAFRIYPLYFFVYFITIALTYRGDIGSFNHPLLNFIAHFFFIQEYIKQEDFVGGSWTLSIELMWYIIFTFIFIISFNRKILTLAIIVFIASLSLSFISGFSMHRIPLGRINFVVACIGGLICLKREHGELTDRKYFFCLSIIVIAIFINLFVGFYINPAKGLIVASFRCVSISWTLGALLFFVPFFTRTSAFWNNYIFSYLGKVSYSIYLIHPIILKIFTDIGLSGFEFVALVFISTVSISFLTYRYIEHTAISFSHSLRHR